MHIKVETGVTPQIGKHYIFIKNGYLKIGLCVKNPSSKPSYDWAMKDIDDDKIYYPYCADLINVDCKVKNAVPTFDYVDVLM